jgi:hypothetical protein
MFFSMYIVNMYSLGCNVPVTDWLEILQMGKTSLSSIIWIERWRRKVPTKVNYVFLYENLSFINCDCGSFLNFSIVVIIYETKDWITSHDLRRSSSNNRYLWVQFFCELEPVLRSDNSLIVKHGLGPHLAGSRPSISSKWPSEGSRFQPFICLVSMVFAENRIAKSQWYICMEASVISFSAMRHAAIC